MINTDEYNECIALTENHLVFSLFNYSKLQVFKWSNSVYQKSQTIGWVTSGNYKTCAMSILQLSPFQDTTNHSKAELFGVNTSCSLWRIIADLD